LVLGIGIARGQYYWVLDVGCLSWGRSNPIIFNTDNDNDNDGDKIILIMINNMIIIMIVM